MVLGDSELLKKSGLLESLAVSDNFSESLLNISKDFLRQCDCWREQELLKLPKIKKELRCSESFSEFVVLVNKKTFCFFAKSHEFVSSFYFRSLFFYSVFNGVDGCLFSVCYFFESLVGGFFNNVFSFINFEGEEKDFSLFFDNFFKIFSEIKKDILFQWETREIKKKQEKEENNELDSCITFSKYLEEQAKEIFEKSTVSESLCEIFSKIISAENIECNSETQEKKQEEFLSSFHEMFVGKLRDFFKETEKQWKELWLPIYRSFFVKAMSLSNEDIKEEVRKIIFEINDKSKKKELENLKDFYQEENNKWVEDKKKIIKKSQETALALFNEKKFNKELKNEINILRQQNVSQQINSQTQAKTNFWDNNSKLVCSLLTVLVIVFGFLLLLKRRKK